MAISVPQSWRVRKKSMTVRSGEHKPMRLPPGRLCFSLPMLNVAAPKLCHLIGANLTATGWAPRGMAMCERRAGHA